MRKFGRRRLPAAYRYVAKNSPSDWAWEFLRRNPDYQADAIAHDPGDHGAKWGLRSAAAPNRSGDQTPIFWRPDVIPILVHLQSGSAVVRSHLRFDPWRWGGRIAGLATAEGLHLTVRLPGSTEYRLLVALDAAAEGTPLLVSVPPDRYWRERVNAAQQFVAFAATEALGATPKPWPTPSEELIERRSHMLWALDLDRSGASARQIGEALFGTSVSAAAWSDHPDRAEVRRLLGQARALMNGGYRSLLIQP